MVMGWHGLAWAGMGLHGLAWAGMGLHGLVWATTMVLNSTDIPLYLVVDRLKQVQPLQIQMP